MTPEDYVRAARSYLGVPFVHQGRSRHGIDCIGLIVCAARDIGLHVDDRTDYPPDPNGELPIELARQTVRVSEPRIGDILLMRFAGEPQHVAIKTDIGMIHAYASVGRVVEHIIDVRWQRRIVSAHRLPGLNAWQS